jgi:hypothetical protein
MPGERLRDTYLLLHFANLELVRAQGRVVLRLIVTAVLLLDDILHLSDQSATSSSNSLASTLQTVLGLAHEGSLYTTSGHELGSAGSDVVRRNDQLLRRVAAGDDAVSGLDQSVG